MPFLCCGVRCEWWRIEPLFGAEDAIISDELNHASIIDGVRLCKAMRYRYKHNNMEDLRQQLDQAKSAGAKQLNCCNRRRFLHGRNDSPAG